VNIVVVDDTPQVLNSSARYIRRLGHQVFTCSKASAVFELLDQQAIHLILSDVCMPEMDGYALLEEIKKNERYRTVIVVLMTGYGDVQGAVRAMRNGAYEYLLKPVDVNELKILIERVAEYITLKEENQQLSRHFDEKVRESTAELQSRLNDLQQALAEKVGLADIGIYSPAMRQVFVIAEKFHRDPSIPVLIEGETGTGKEVIARFIHYGYDMTPTSFIDINCASISPSLFESELFGYEGGSFTGAKSKGEKGKIEMARNGTLFLDEISELPLPMQAKLLRVIQEREYYPVGGTKKLSTNARFISATNRNIWTYSESGEFRKDLYFRLQVGHLVIPPLRERREEIIPLANLFLKQFQKLRKTSFTKISNAAAVLLQTHDWSGNVRELKNAIEKITVFFEDEAIEPRHCEFVLHKQRDDTYSENSTFTPLNPQSLPDNQFDLKDWDQRIVQLALQKNGFNKSRTAQYLGLTRNELYTYLSRIDKDR